MSSVSDRSLHCLYAAPDSGAAMRLRESLASDDPVLLLDKAVTLTRATHPELANWLATGAQLYALQDDLDAYVVTDVHVGITPVSYADWVRLTERYRTQALWR